MINVFGNKHDKQIIKDLNDCISSGWLGCGKHVKHFETLMSKRYHKPFVMTNNGSNALHLAVRLLNLPKKSKIVIPSFTFIACIHAILMEGHIPVIADVDQNGNLDIKSIKKTKISAIMVVHYGGRPCDMNEICATRLPIIEDVAHAFDSSINKKMCGTFGTVSAFSFDPIKNISTPDSGGVLLTPNNKEKAIRLRDLGISSTGISSNKNQKWWENKIHDVFPKYLPNDVAAIFAKEQLSILEENQKIRKKIWQAYQNELQNVGNIIIENEISPGHKHSYFTYLIKVKKNRNGLADFMKRNEIYTTLRFQPLHKIKMFKSFAKNTYANSEYLGKHGLNLPLHPNMTDNDLDKVICTIKSWKSKQQP